MVNANLADAADRLAGYSSNPLVVVGLVGVGTLTAKLARSFVDSLVAGRLGGGAFVTAGAGFATAFALLLAARGLGDGIAGAVLAVASLGVTFLTFADLM